MRFLQSVAFTETEQLVELARAAEEVGFDGVCLSDHVVHPERIASRYPYSPDGRPPFGPETPWPEPWALIAAMAAATTRLGFMTNVYILPLRHPLEVAKATGTVAVLSGHRVALGVGAGWMREEFDLLGREFHGRGRRMEEMIDILRKLWAGGWVEHRGEHYTFDRLRLEPAPGRPLPVYVGGTSEAALRRAARIGDGWVGSGNDPAEVPEIVSRLRALRREAGREGAPFEVIVALTVAPDPDLFRRLEDEGVTAVVSFPFFFTLGPRSSLDDKRRALEGFAARVIARLR
jgi:probable F420-dependent oxidoreductase